MKQVADSNGIPIRGLFKKPDGSLVVNDAQSYNKSRIQHETITTLNNEVKSLKEQVKKILEHINGKP